MQVASSKGKDTHVKGGGEILEHARTVIPLSRWRILLPLLPALLFVTVGVWLFLKEDFAVGSRFYSYPWLAKTIGAITSLWFGAMGALVFWKLFDRRPGITIDSRGITDWSSVVSIGLIAWEDIESISVQEGKSPNFLYLNLRNPEKYVGRARNRFHAYLLRSNIRWRGTPVSLTASTLNCSFRELDTAVTAGLVEWGGR